MNDETTVVGDDLRPVPAGVVGKLARRGHVPLGYYKDPEKSAATFPVIDGDRWSVPGDHARIEADGTITVLGRGSVSINTGGEKVYPEEVESALKSHPAVFDAVVVGVPDDRWGERVTAVVQPRPGADPDARGSGRAHARRSSRPTRCRATSCSSREIVRSPSGKPDYRWALATAEARLGDAVACPHVNRLARRDQSLPAPARRQPRRLVPVGRRSVRTGPGRGQARSCCRSGTRRAIGAT